ncbi:hypothetical protein CRX69_12340 [Pseudomonas rhizophila]|uniref:Uncharacterized protein n=1 Tax=Pseudomonas rhizophila TaxID=2045200 RepID=A0ABN5JU51_9PSED|nr:hypothetical protein CRX69_12340 [Pseudomonas rhizophila]MBD0702668.1 hypothetical protein [Pseudomonas sp. PSB1]
MSAQASRVVYLPLQCPGWTQICARPQIKCGSEPARDSGGAACIDVEWADVIASRLAPTGTDGNRKTPDTSCQHHPLQRNPRVYCRVL